MNKKHKNEQKTKNMKIIMQTNIERISIWLPPPSKNTLKHKNEQKTQKWTQNTKQENCYAD